jgi:hypothetical protein
LLAKDLDHIRRKGNHWGSNESDKAEPASIGGGIGKSDILSSRLDSFFLEPVEHIPLGLPLSRAGKWNPEKLEPVTLPYRTHLKRTIFELHKVNGLDGLIGKDTW